jgi:hypothetical protein
MTRSRSIPWRPALLAAAAVLVVLNGPAQAQKDFWPKKLQHPKGTITMYQPQLEDFEGDYLKGLAAISGQTKEMKQPVFGAVLLEGRLASDRDSRMGTIEQVRILDPSFPTPSRRRLRN